MTQEELKELENIEEIKHLITIKDLKDKSDRTLLFGYTCDRDTWHVYINNNKIISICYSYNEKITEGNTIIIEDNEDYVPNKRLYPERCDFEFCKLLKEYGINLPFTYYDNNIENKKYYGKILKIYEI